MTRKDFDFIARTLGKIEDEATRTFVASLFAKELPATNGNFDPHRFHKAVNLYAWSEEN